MTEPDPPSEDPYRAAHQRRLAHMPWLYDRLKPAQRAWAEPWQRRVQAELCAVEQVRLGEGGFLAPDAALFAEPRREIVLGDRFRVASRVFVHGPVRAGADLGLNVGAVLDGGAAGIELGSGVRIAAGASLYAWNHGIAPDAPVREQPTSSEGIRIGDDVWIGARVVVTDGVTLGDHVVVGAGAVVTKSFPSWAIVAGNPARQIGDRRDRAARGTPSAGLD